MNTFEIMFQLNVMLTELAIRPAGIAEADKKELDHYLECIAEAKGTTPEQAKADLIDGMGYEIPMDSDWEAIVEYIREGLASGELVTC